MQMSQWRIGQVGVRGGEAEIFCPFSYQMPRDTGYISRSSPNVLPRRERGSIGEEQGERVAAHPHRDHA